MAEVREKAKNEKYIKEGGEGGRGGREGRRGREVRNREERLRGIEKARTKEEEGGDKCHKPAHHHAQTP